jgi:hypothetical protein
LVSDFERLKIQVSQTTKKNVFTTTIYKHQRIQEGQSKMDNPEKLAT